MSAESEDPEDPGTGEAATGHYESERHGFAAPHVGSGEPEFEDEPPGSYIGQLPLGEGAVLWGGALLGIELILIGFALGLDPWIRIAFALDVLVNPGLRDLSSAMPTAVSPLVVAWSSLPIVAVSSLLVALFARANLRLATRAQRLLTNWAIWLQLGILAIWVIARSMGLDFQP